MGSHNLLGPDTLGGCSTALKASRRERQTQKVFLLFWNVGGENRGRDGRKKKKDDTLKRPWKWKVEELQSLGSSHPM